MHTGPSGAVNAVVKYLLRKLGDVLRLALVLAGLGGAGLSAPQASQTPARIVPYSEEEVTLVNGDVTLAGTLTVPPGKGPFPAVVLLTGRKSGNPSEYALLEKVFVSGLLDDISGWIAAHTR